jgi:hypothetical protein
MNRNAVCGEPLVQRRQYAARFHMSFPGKKQRIIEAAGERRLECSDARAIDMLMTVSQARKTLVIGAIARMRDDERAIEDRIPSMLAPEIERALAKAGD